MKELSEKIGGHQYAAINCTCMDCGEDFTIHLERTGPTQIEIKDGVIGKRDNEYYFKCPDCWETDKNFGQRTEVYSRVVGYLRPVSNWNEAKREEFKMRKVYK